jgi:hypothetical protein
VLYNKNVTDFISQTMTDVYTIIVVITTSSQMMNSSTT